MHEGNFTNQIVESILAELKNHPGVRPSAISIKVGETYHLEPESVKTHFQMLTQGTPLEGASLELTEIPMTVKCKSCGWSGPVEDHHLPMCSECDETAVDILTGNEIEIEPFEVEQE